MRPAYSVIFFTVASGAGYGLLGWIGIAALLGWSIRSGAILVGLVIALVLVTAGLLASSAHLGRPERAWRAFSQWRSSWLSREGIAAVATYLPALALIAATLFPRVAAWRAPAGILSAAGAIATVTATSMIYASLKPIREWRHLLVPVIYMLHAAMSGALLLAAIMAVSGTSMTLAAIAAIATTLGAAAAKLSWWRAVDRPAASPTVASATGLVDGGAIRSLQWPHSERNYLLKEMGFRVARKHSRRLRVIATALAYVVPIPLVGASLALSKPIGVLLLCIAVAMQLAGLLVERWLFFAEATHSVTLYYGYADPPLVRQP